MISRSYQCCILGAGPAGLGAALELTKNGIRNVVIIDRNRTAGGLSRTEIFDDVRFDLGPHRFFTKNAEINKLWHDILGSDFRPVDRLTRIYYKNKYFNYPIKAFDALSKLGPFQALQALFSFAHAQIGEQREPDNFEAWITQKFGRKLYETFFKTYTEKVWGIPCHQIGAEWAAQRIKDLDLFQVIKKALSPGSSKKIKTLVEQFDFPVLGAGQMYERMCDQVMEKGVTVMMNSRVLSFNRQDTNIESIEVINNDGNRERISAEYFFTSIPITLFFEMMDPPESDDILKSVNALYFRDHITVNLLVDGDDLFPDQWIYIHTPDVKTARVANYNNFSKQMTSRKNKSALSAEYFVFQNEDLWKETDDNLKVFAIEELAYLKLLHKSSVENSWIVRETETYPTYYIGFQEHYENLKSRLDQFQNLQPIGRGGMYKYNNQDHSILSGILAARNYLKFPGTPYNLWSINIDAEYHESAARNP